LSRIPSRRLTRTPSQPQSPDGDGSFDRAEQARALFGSEAPLAVAYCALDAWLDGEEEEYRSLASLFQRLSN